jgi:serine/threonine-protein kinase
VRDLLDKALGDTYLIERELGQGGMGAVYLAQDQRLQRPVAIKVLPPELAVRAELRERFLRETRMAAGFSHPNIVPVFAVEDHDDLLCFVMGYIEGETLTQRVRRGGPLNAPEVIRLLQEVAWALSYAHGRGVVHRDIKPDNILIERATGRALVTDFGIARSSAVALGESLTRVGESVGTPEFMSPEQAAGESVDARSDLYSLGVVAFFAVTGRLPFSADSGAALMAMHVTQPAPKVGPLRPDLPAALCAAIDKCLDKDPDNRFASGESLAAALEAMRSSRRAIAPTLRLFQMEATQGFRAALIVALLEVLFILHPIGHSSAAALPLIIGAGIIWGIAVQTIGRARALLAAGFSFDDACAGLDAILTERAEARTQKLVDPRARRLSTRRRRVVIAGGLYGVVTWIWVLETMRKHTGPNEYAVNLPGTIILFSSATMIGLSLAVFIMNSSGASMVDRAVAALWRGPLGRLAFRLAARRALPAAGVAATFATSSAGIRSVIASLPAARRRELGDVKQRVRQLETSLQELAARVAGLDDAIAQAGDASFDSDPASRLRRQELVADLVAARDEASASRLRLSGALENVRLQLLRLKSGVGADGDVAAELRTAEALAHGSQPASVRAAATAR